MPVFEEEVCVSVDGVKVEDENPVRTELNAWDVKEDSLADGEDLDQKCSSGVLSWCKEDSLDSGSIQGKFTDEGRLKEEDEDEPCFRVGDNCYKGISPALNTHKGPKTDADLKSGGDQSPCPECSGASQESPRLCSRCRLWTEHIRPGITHLRQDDSTGTRQKRKRKERRFGMRKTRTAKLSLKSRVAKSSLQRAASSIKKKDRRRKLGKQFDGKAMMLARRESEPALPPAEPTFQLVCSSLDDLRVLISKTEDQLDDLDGGKKRSGRWPHKRATVKELHITLIRLLNELLPWEPKLLKAFQRNRARLKKECDDFKKHPDYENFIREQMDTTDTGEVGCLSKETTRELVDGEGKMSRTMKDDSETTENVNQLGNHVLRCVVDGPETVMHASESGPFTRSSKRRQSGAICDDMCKRGKMEPESSSEHDFEVASREQPTVLPEPMSSIQGTCKPIQALLAKSFGNKVTLISHPKAAVMAQILRDHKTAPVTVPVQLSTTCSPHSEPITTETSASTTTSTTESTGPVVYKTAGGVGLLRKGSTSVKFSVQPLSEQKSGEKVMQQVVILPSNLLIQSTENKASQTSASVSKNATFLSNALGFTIPENKVPVQQVAPLKDTSTVRTPSAVVTPSLRTLTTLGVPKKTTEPKVAGTSGLTKPDAKEELRTVCIRDSQSILVTTRGGNTGVVKVQMSESGTGALPPSPVFNISPQLQAFLVSKSSTSTTQAVSASLAAKSVPGVTPQSLSKDVVPFGSSTFMEGADTPLNQICHDAKTLIPGKSALLASSKSSESVLVPVKDVQGIQNTVPKCGMKPPQKRTLPGSRTLDQPALQKVFLVAPSQNICSAASKVTTTTATCAMPASRVMFFRNPALTIPKDVSTSEVSISSTSTPALRVIPKLGTTLSCTSSGMSVQSIGVPGLTSRILGADNKPGATGKSTPVIISRVSPTSASSGLQVSPKSSLVASRSPTGNTENSLKVPGTVDGKMLTFSSLGTGHMASSALLSLVKPDVPSSVSTLNALHCKPGLTTGSSSLSISSSYAGSLITKHTTLPIDVTANKTGITSLCTSTSPIITTVNACATRVSNSVSSSASAPPLVMTSGIRPHVKSVQEKIVINTSTPLAPGTQLLINNTRFVVPSQGLGPGSHVLLINSCPGGSQGPSPVRPGGSHGPSPNSAVLRGPNSLASQTVPSGVQGMRLVTPIRLPSPKIGPSEAHQQLGSRTPLNVSSPTALSQVAQALRPMSSDIVRLPIFQSSDVSIPPTPGMTRSPKETSFSQGGLPSTTSPMLLQGRHSQNQAMPMKPAIARNSPMVSVPPMSSAISRMQKLPVATVPPIGGPTSTSSATPIATVPPSVNTVIMTPCTTIRAVQPGTIGKPVILPQLPQRQNTFPIQVPTSSKLLLSPDGAVLNIVQAASVQVLAKPMAAQVVSSSSSSVIVSDDPLRESDPLGRPNH